RITSCPWLGQVGVKVLHTTGGQSAVELREVELVFRLRTVDHLGQELVTDLLDDSSCNLILEEIKVIILLRLWMFFLIGLETFTKDLDQISITLRSGCFNTQSGLHIIGRKLDDLRYFGISAQESVFFHF